MKPNTQSPGDAVPDVEITPQTMTRAAACMAACHGLSYAELESGLVPAPNFIRMRSQRDKLLATLKAAYVILDRDGDEWGICDQLRATIAEVEAVGLAAGDTATQGAA